MLDRTTMPHDTSAERALLGGLLTAPEQLVRIEAVVAASDFYRPEHGLLFALIQGMAREDQGIDLVTVSERILRGGHPDRYGGAGYVADLPDHCPSTANLPHYATTIRRKAAMRAVIKLAHDMEATAREETVDPIEALDTVAAQVLSLAGEERRASDEGTLGEAIADAADARVSALQNRQASAIETRFYGLDEILNGGLRPGDLVIVGADTSMGKTSLAIAMAAGLGAHGHAVGYVMLEGSKREFADRFLSNVSRIELRKFRQPVRKQGDAFVSTLTDEDERLITGWREALDLWPVRWWVQPGATWAAISAQARRWKMAHGLRLLVVDYVQLVFTERGRDQRPDEALGNVAKQAKALAESLGITVCLLSQLTNRGEKPPPPGRRQKLVDGTPWYEQVELPRRNQLRGSAELEHAADVILFPVRANQLGLPIDDPAEAIVSVAKNRHGRTGVVSVRWDGRCAAYRPDGWRS